MEACEKLTGVDDLTSLIQVPLNLETPANNSPDVTWIQLKPTSNTSKAFFSFSFDFTMNQTTCH